MNYKGKHGNFLKTIFFTSFGPVHNFSKCLILQNKIFNGLLKENHKGELFLFFFNLEEKLYIPLCHIACTHVFCLKRSVFLFGKKNSLHFVQGFQKSWSYCTQIFATLNSHETTATKLSTTTRYLLTYILIIIALQK